LVVLGIVASGYPATTAEGAVTINFFGQVGGMIVMALIGFVPGFLFAWLFKVMGILRTSEAVEIAGLDISEVPAVAYPEGSGAGAK